MEKNQYNLCLEVFKRFEKVGVLSQVIMIGSWCVIFYEKYFKNSEGLKDFVLRTRDIDFLIANPVKLKGKINLPDLLKDLGFVVSYQGRKGYMKLTHEDLLLEFLVPEKGRGVDGPVALPALGMNAVALRFLNFLTYNTIQVKVDGCVLTLPHPANFALHKLIVAQRRIKEDKALKDNQAAISVLKTLIANGQSESIRKAFSEVPSKWQKKIIAGLKAVDESEMLNLF